ncbi:hypothetical protein [Pseudolysinimonas sp.]
MTVVAAFGLVAAFGNRDDRDPPTSARDEPEPPRSVCLPVSAGALAALNELMLHDAQVERAAAVLVSPDTDGSPEWFVAGALTGPGLEGATAIWHTIHDPTRDGTNAYTSVDAMAREFSQYAQPEGSHGGLLNAQDAVSCLD